MALLVEGLSPGGESTCIEEYIVAPATEADAGRDCIKLYGPTERAASMVAQPLSGQMSSIIMSRQGSMGISQSPSLKDPLVILFGSMHEHESLPESTTAGPGTINKVTSVSSNMGDIEAGGGTSDNLHTPLLLSRQASSAEHKSKLGEIHGNTSIGGGWQLVYKSAGGNANNNEGGGIQRVYLHPEAAGGGAQRATSFMSTSGMDLTNEGDPSSVYPASALVSQSVLGTKLLTEIEHVSEQFATATAPRWRALLEPGVTRALIVGIGLQILQQVPTLQ